MSNEVYSEQFFSDKTPRTIINATIGLIIGGAKDTIISTDEKEDINGVIVFDKNGQRNCINFDRTQPESKLRTGAQLHGMGVEDELLRLGAKKGDDIQIEDYIFQFKE